MASTKQVNPREVRDAVEAGAAVRATQAAVQDIQLRHVGPEVTDAASKTMLSKATEMASKTLTDCFLSVTKLAKNALGSVAGVFGVFGGLRRIMGGI